MFTRTQKDDLRFVRDCLLANGDGASEAFVQWLTGLNPRLTPLLPVAPKARRLFLSHAFELILGAAEGPGEPREQLRDFGRLLAALELTPAQFQAAGQKLTTLLAETCGRSYSDRVDDASTAALALAVAWLQDGMQEARGGAEEAPAPDSCGSYR